MNVFDHIAFIHQSTNLDVVVWLLVEFEILQNGQF